MGYVLTWIPPLESRRSNLKAFLETGIHESLGVLANEVKDQLLDAARLEAPHRTGAYADTLRVTQTAAAAGGNTIKLMGASPLSTWITKGTAPHVILPVRAKFLHWSDAGGEHFARGVQHPGTKPNPFADRALEESADNIIERARDWGRGIVVMMRG